MLEVPSSSSMATNGRVGRWKFVKIALLVLVLASAVDMAVSVAVAASAVVVDLVVVVDLAEVSGVATVAMLEAALTHPLLYLLCHLIHSLTLQLRVEKRAL